MNVNVLNKSICFQDTFISMTEQLILLVKNDYHNKVVYSCKKYSTK